MQCTEVKQLYDQKYRVDSAGLRGMTSSLRAERTRKFWLYNPPRWPEAALCGCSKLPVPTLEMLISYLQISSQTEVVSNFEWQKEVFCVSQTER